MPKDRSATGALPLRSPRSIPALRSLKGRFSLAFALLATVLAATAHYAHYSVSGKGLAWHLSELLWTLLATLPVGLLGGWLLLRWLLEPVRRIEQTAQQITAGRLEMRIDPADVDVELAHAAESINSMLDQLEAVREKLSHFNDNLFHEVLGPVHAIQLQVEVGGAPQRSREELQQCVAAIGGRARHLETICETLLAFSQSVTSDAATLPSIDLEPIIESAIERVRPHWQRAAVCVENRVGSLMVCGQQDLLELVLVNLIDNAVGHSPRGSVVTLARRSENESVAVLVEDHGPGVPAEAEPHIFKMHTSAREQRHTPPGQVATRQGHGVGLAICRSIMQSHRGDVFYEPTSGGGATFVLRFPRAGGCDVEPQ